MRYGQVGTGVLMLVGVLIIYGNLLVLNKNTWMVTSSFEGLADLQPILQDLLEKLGSNWSPRSWGDLRTQ